MGGAISISMVAVFLVAIFLNNLIDMLGFKKILISGVVILSLGTIGIFLSRIFVLFTFSYFLFQMGLGILSITIISIIGKAHYRERASRILQLSIFYTIGNMLAPLVAGITVGLGISWKLIFLSIFIVLVIFGALLVKVEVPEIERGWKGSRNLLKFDRKIVFNSFFMIIMLMAVLYSAVMDTYYTWFTSYFESLNISVSRSSLFLSLYLFALLAGLIIKNQIVKKISEKKLLIWGVFLSFVFIILSYFIKNITLKNIMIFLYGICITGNFSFLIIIALNLGAKYSSVIATYLHAMAFLGSIVFQYVCGLMSEHLSKNSVFYIDAALILMIFILAVIINRKKMVIENLA
jgi:MFS family permease